MKIELVWWTATTGSSNSTLVNVLPVQGTQPLGYSNSISCYGLRNCSTRLEYLRVFDHR